MESNKKQAHPDRPLVGGGNGNLNDFRKLLLFLVQTWCSG